MDLLKQAAKELGRRGGTKTSKIHGKKHYQRLAANMNRKLGRRVDVDKSSIAKP